MSSHCRVETTSKGYQSGMNSVTDVTSGGDSPHAEFIAGMTAGEVAKGHSSAHADYLARTRNMETYLGSTGQGGGGGGGSDGGGGMGDIKEMFGAIKGMFGGLCP